MFTHRTVVVVDSTVDHLRLRSASVPPDHLPGGLQGSGSEGTCRPTASDRDPTGHLCRGFARRMPVWWSRRHRGLLSRPAAPAVANQHRSCVAISVACCAGANSAKSTDMADRDFTRTLRRARRLPEYPAHGLRSRAGYWPVITAVRIVLEVPEYNVAFERCGVRGD